MQNFFTSNFSLKLKLWNNSILLYIHSLMNHLSTFVSICKIQWALTTSNVNRFSLVSIYDILSHFTRSPFVSKRIPSILKICFLISPLQRTTCSPFFTAYKFSYLHWRVLISAHVILRLKQKLLWLFYPTILIIYHIN